MLKKVRDYARSGIGSYALVAFLTVVFIFFFGVPTQWCGERGGPRSPDKLAKIDGRTIYTSDLSILYNNPMYTMAVEQAQKRKRGQQGQTDNQDGNPRIRSEALKTMLIVELLSDKARKLGFRVGTEEFKEFMKDPLRNMDYQVVYGRNGSWNGARYQQYVKRRLLTKPERYEAYKRKELLASKYLNLLEMQIGVLPEELKHLNDLKNTKVNLRFVKFNADILKDAIEVSDEDVETFKTENGDKIEKYYKDNKSKYNKPAKVRVRRVFIPKGGEDDSKESVFESAKTRVLDKGESMKQVARDLSDGQQNPGGLMDWSTWDNLDQNLAKALKDAKKGEVKTVTTDYAYMLAKVEEKKEGKKTSLDEVRGEIAKTLVKEKRAEQAYTTLGEQLYSQLSETGSLEKAVAKFKENNPLGKVAEIKETGMFNLEGEQPSGMAARFGIGGTSWKNIPKIGESKKLKVDAFKKLTKDNPIPPRPYEVGKSTVVVELKERQEAKDKTLEENKLAWAGELRSRKVKGILGRWSPGQWARVLAVPRAEFGPWVNNIYKKAVNDGRIKLFKNNEAAKMADPNAVEMTPSQVKKLQQGGGSKSIKINQGSGGSGDSGDSGDSGGEGRTIKLNPNKGKSGSSGSK